MHAATSALEVASSAPCLSPPPPPDGCPPPMPCARPLSAARCELARERRGPMHTTLICFGGRILSPSPLPPPSFPWSFATHTHAHAFRFLSQVSMSGVSRLRGERREEARESMCGREFKMEENLVISSTKRGQARDSSKIYATTHNGPISGAPLGSYNRQARPACSVRCGGRASFGPRSSCGPLSPRRRLAVRPPLLVSAAALLLLGAARLQSPAPAVAIRRLRLRTHTRQQTSQTRVRTTEAAMVGDSSSGSRRGGEGGRGWMGGGGGKG